MILLCLDRGASRIIARVLCIFWWLRCGGAGFRLSSIQTSAELCSVKDYCLSRMMNPLRPFGHDAVLSAPFLGATKELFSEAAGHSLDVLLDGQKGIHKTGVEMGASRFYDDPASFFVTESPYQSCVLRPFEARVL